MARDCVVLLAYVSKHPSEHQTFRGLAEAIGVPEQTVWAIVRYARKEGEASMLGMVAKKHGYVYCIFADCDNSGRRVPGGRIIDACRGSDWVYDRLESPALKAGVDLDSPSIEGEDLNELE